MITNSDDLELFLESLKSRNRLFQITSGRSSGTPCTCIKVNVMLDLECGHQGGLRVPGRPTTASL